ncbi:MAG: hypothetical protein HYX85_00355 [Chloroflexi bacterium]|nr:hypothetical protein [Chloroflexota bacterium]
MKGEGGNTDMTDDALKKFLDRATSVALTNIVLTIVPDAEWERAVSEVETAIGRPVTAREKEVFVGAYRANLMMRILVQRLGQAIGSVAITSLRASSTICLCEILRVSLSSADDLKVRSIAWRMAREYPWP